MSVKILLVVFVFSLADCEYDEKYRPQFHFSPIKGWLNDPNGLVFHDGSYELFYQFYPNDKNGGPKYWGHAKSTDLFHWQNLPVALSPTKVGSGNVEMWSGSAIVDTRNVSGYQSKDNPNHTMLAFFTGHYEPGFNETQWMAYSTDNGIKWQFYDKNPIIPNPGSRDFRDPKVFEYNGHYVIVVTAGDRVRFYNSTDLKNWSYMSDFGNGQGSHAGVWECCDLFKFNGTKNNWVLLVNQDGFTQYFVGNFDGHSFINANPKETILSVDYGPDGYAGVTYNSAPDNRRIFISWLNSGPTDPWRGVMSLPREMSLIESEGKQRLASVPAREIIGLRTGPPKSIASELKANSPISVTNVTSNLLDIELIFELNHKKNPKDKLGIEFRGSKDSLRVYFNDEYVIDRSNAGRNDGTKTAPRLTDSQSLQMRVILDISTVELFADNGLTAMTALFYSEDKLNTNIKIFYETSDQNSHSVINYKLLINQLKSVWH